MFIVSVEDILHVEVDALCQTICEYTNDNYIQSYAKQLTRLEYPQEIKTIGILVSRLLEWYKVELPAIQNDPYIRSKNAHKKSYDLLCEISEQLQKN